jgi:hypothetical protein
MAKKQSRRSVSLSRLTYERLRAYCESNGVSMSQFVEGRIGDFLGGKPFIPPAPRPSAPLAVRAPEVVAPRPVVAAPAPIPVVVTPAPAPAPAPAPVVARPVVAAPTPAPVAAPVAAVRAAIPSAPNPGQRAAFAEAPKKPVDEAAARRAAERIFTF